MTTSTLVKPLMSEICSQNKLANTVYMPGCWPRKENSTLTTPPGRTSLLQVDIHIVTFTAHAQSERFLEPALITCNVPSFFSISLNPELRSLVLVLSDRNEVGVFLSFLFYFTHFYYCIQQERVTLLVANPNNEHASMCKPFSHIY